MSLAYLIVIIVITIIVNLTTRNKGRVPVLLGISALAVYAFQPALPIRGLDFWLPTATLTLAVLGWVVTTPSEQRSWRKNWPAATVLGGTSLLLGLTRLIGYPLPLTASRPPQLLQILFALALIASAVILLQRTARSGGILLWASIGLILGIFILLKSPVLTAKVSLGLRFLNGQNLQEASALDLRWLGFSYIAFRLLHTIRDRQSARLPPVSLAEYVVYIIFFPSLTAGPIDRIERFIADLRQPRTLSSNNWTEAGRRLIIGFFKKFVVADSLGLIALNGTNAMQVRTTGWTWVLLYAFAFQIYFDFSGYTDIAIGMGRLLGFCLPENFASPYLKPNLTRFWNSWHITLTQWFRAYFFNPLTRALRSAKKPLPIPLVIFITQVLTMALIGLWHGITINFTLWGLWHGLGLFIQNRWSDATRGGYARLSARWQKALNVGGVLLTFHFVTLGWVFFALPGVSATGHVFKLLFGIG